MRTVQTVLDFFLETPQAYFCDRCGECHRAGECHLITREARPRARGFGGGLRPPSSSLVLIIPDIPVFRPGRRTLSRPRRAHRLREDPFTFLLFFSFFLWILLFLFSPGFLGNVPSFGSLGAVFSSLGLDLDLPLISPANADPAAVPRRRVRSDG
jgi:hypothetical protein